MRLSVFCAAALVAVLLVPVAPAFSVGAEPSAAPKAATPWLKKLVDRAKTLAERKVETGSTDEEQWHTDIKATIDEILDWPELTEKSLGRYWKERSDKEKNEFSTLLREMIEASYKSKLKVATNGDVKKPQKVDITWLSEKLEGTHSTVTAKVKSDKTTAVLEFYLNWYKGSGWRVYDVSIDDVSTVRTYRTQFGKIISKQGFAGLMDRMHRKVTEVRAGKADIAP